MPRFDYDGDTLRSRGANILDEVAQCMVDGSLKDQRITLVGRADPRGSARYNQALGVSRAEAARSYLVQRGVSSDNLVVTSRGEQGATGHDEGTWELDRRVDLEMGDLREAGNQIGAQSANRPEL
jgi:peptidoglycan-associated lipoprotein